MHIFREAHTRAARSPGRERRETERAQNASARAGPGGTTNTTNRPSLHGQESAPTRKGTTGRRCRERGRQRETAREAARGREVEGRQGREGMEGSGDFSRLGRRHTRAGQTNMADV